MRRWDSEFLSDVLEGYVPPSRDAINRWEEEILDARKPPTGLVGPPLPRDLLVVWPETSVPRSVDQRRPERLPSEIYGLAANTPHADLLVGVAGSPNRDDQRENGSIIVAGDGIRWAHSKLRLVPYGEVVPFREAVRFLEYPWGDDDITGSKTLEPVEWRGRSIGALICFDNVFPYVTRKYAAAGAGSFILMTNNSWYKLESGIRQHCDMDILRAVECRKPLSRVSTTGWSQLIDSAGRIVRTSDINRRGVVYGEVVPRHGETAYVRLGDAFALLCLLASLVIAATVIIPGESEGLL
jgi:apolipoprotein N-acyltransferase